MSSLKQRKQGRRAPLDRIRLEVACNDERGHFAARAEALCFAARGEWIHLDLSSGTAPRFAEHEDAITIFRRRCLTLESRTWFGNWCWNAYVIALPAAAFVLARAIDSGKFSFDCAEGDHACRIAELCGVASTVSADEIAVHLQLFGEGA